MTSTPSSTIELLAALSDNAGRSMDDAFSLPADFYTDPGILDLEIERIFHQEWLCAGRADAISKPGDYLTYNIGQQPVVIIRQKDHSLKAFANVCRHRMMQLFEGAGSCKQGRVTCPYHAWTYAADGSLLAAPHMDSRPGFDKADYSLKAVRLEVWHGWIYVTLNNEAKAVRKLLKSLDPLVSVYGMADYSQFVQQDHIWETNWKLLAENFMEGYHLPVTHRTTVGSRFPVEETDFGDDREHQSFTYQYFMKGDKSYIGTAHPDNTRLQGDDRNRSIMPTVFPSHMYVLAPDHLWYLSLQPRGVSEVQIRFGAALAPEVAAASENLDELTGELIRFLDGVNAEDKFVVEGIMKGARSPMTSQGPLNWLEKELLDFCRYLNRRLNTAQVHVIQEDSTS